MELRCGEKLRRRQVKRPEARHRGSKDFFGYLKRGRRSGQRSGQPGRRRRIDGLSEPRDLAILNVSNNTGN